MSFVAGDVVEGLEVALQGMRQGEVAEVTVLPGMGYGQAATQAPLAEIPPSSVLLYTVELLWVEQVDCHRAESLGFECESDVLPDLPSFARSAEFCPICRVSPLKKEEEEEEITSFQPHQAD